MEIVLVVLVVVVLLAQVAFYIRVNKKNPEDAQQNILIETLKGEVQAIRAELKDSMQSSLSFLQGQSHQSNQIIQHVTERLERVESTNKQIVGFATQLQSLENILKNPKQRGVLGEFVLETLLSSTLAPVQFKMQYAFGNGEIVDAAIFVRDKVIPIDAKFSLEKYNALMNATDDIRDTIEKDFKRDIKDRIDETAKYVRPDEGTTDFAFMFIPAEGVYYNLVISKVGASTVSQKDLIEYAFTKKVVIVSPTTFFAYLQTVLQALRALQVEESVKEIRLRIDELAKHIVNYDSSMKRLGSNLGTTVNAFNLAHKEFVKIDKDIVRINSGEKSIEPLELEKPITIE